jgi:SAM-dependent methyltransferase
MDESLIFRMFEGLKRQGPGSDACTRRMFSSLPKVPENPRILDIGCGSGMQTLELARLAPGGHITAVDIHQPFLDDVKRNAEAAGLSGRIKAVRASMDDLPFEKGSFDIIWAEGSVFIIGLEKGLRYWRGFIRPGGYLALSDLVWFTDNPSPEAAEFIAGECPNLMNEEQAPGLARDCGYSVIDSFRLPDSVWWTHYYNPLSAHLDQIGGRSRSDAEAEDLIARLRKEIEMFRKYSTEYGYLVLMLGKS